MKSITIHGLDSYLDQKIKVRAQKEGISFKKDIKKMLEESLGGSKPTREDNRKDFWGFISKLVKRRLN